MIKEKRVGGTVADDRLPIPSQSAFPPHCKTRARGGVNNGMKMQDQKKVRQICAGRRYKVEVEVRSIEENGANLTRKQLL